MAEPVLAAEEIHLWCVPLDRDAVRLDVCRAMLDGAERERHDRYRFDVHRDRFALRRGALREILGRYLGCEPAAVRFAVGPAGRPEIPGAPLRFNLSDSDDLALLGVTREVDLGVDVERVVEIPDRDAVAARFFSPAELVEYRAVPEDSKLLAFYLTWTRKEAWLKARGVGLGPDLASFDVTVAPGSPARLLRVAGEDDEPLRWMLCSEVPRAGFVAAVAARARDLRIVRCSR
jgi:4'-phosphopantetheinyl transferase